jgi:hypothetical protein
MSRIHHNLLVLAPGLTNGRAVTVRHPKTLIIGSTRVMFPGGVQANLPRLGSPQDCGGASQAPGGGAEIKAGN